jgi:hypothetical protein
MTELKVGMEVLWTDDDGENIGIIANFSTDLELVKVMKCVDYEGLEVTDEEVTLLCDEVKQYFGGIKAKAEAKLQEGGIVSWSTSIGDYYGDILHIATEGTLRGEPQGTEIEASADKPAYAVRVWMWDEEEWEATNSMVVTYAESLTALDKLPEPMDEPANGEDMSKDISDSLQAQIADIVAQKVADALVAAGLIQYKSDDAVAEEATTSVEEVVAEVSEEVATDVAEVASDVAEEVKDDVVADDAEYEADDADADSEAEEKAAGAMGRVVPTHKTGVDTTKPWDGPMNKTHIKSPSTSAYFDKIYAYQRPNTVGDMKAHYSFIHHFVGADGTPGEASFAALSSAIATLNGGRAGTVLRGAARQGVYRHLASHYKDAGRPAPELKGDDFVDSLMIQNGIIGQAIIPTEDNVAEMKSIEDINAEFSIVEETSIDSAVEEKSDETVIETAVLTYEDLKQFHDLIKVL